MRILVITNGSRGDVQPYLLLAQELERAGHQIRFATMDRFEDLVAQFGFEFVALEYEPLREFWQAIAGMLCRPSLRRWRVLKERTLRALNSWLEASAGMDCIVAHPLIYAAADLAMDRGIPLVVASTLPAVCPTGAFPNSYLFSRSMGRVLNRLSYRLMPLALLPATLWRLRWRRTSLRLEGCRQGLLSSRRLKILHLHAWSPAALPRPDDWRPEYKVTGFWQGDFPADMQVVARLTKFIAAGSQPLYIGFGSALGPDPGRLTECIVRGLQETGQRAIISRGSGSLDPDLAYKMAPDLVFPLKEGVPHSWLFNQVSGIVHHGGPGTFGAALSAGKPQLICPFNMDQPFWGQRAFELGVAPPPLKAAKLNVSRFAARIRQLAPDSACGSKAAGLAPSIREENGLLAARIAIEEFVKSD